MRELTVTEQEHDQRLDRFVKKYLNLAPHAFVQRMIRKKNITLNGKRAKPDDMIAKGDVVRLFLAEETIEKMREVPSVKAAKGQLSIAYEDEYVLVMNKPAGLLTHGRMGKGQAYEDNMVDRMVAYLTGTGAYDPRQRLTFTPAMANRLDRNTSGLLIGCKTYEALKTMNEGMREGGIRRRYLAVVEGVARDREETAYIVRDDKKNRTKVVTQPTVDGKKIMTGMKRLADNGEFSLVEVELYTGRTHQIRAQMKAWGHPILGDPKYGTKRGNAVARDYGLTRQWLHAYQVSFQGLPSPLAHLNEQMFQGEVPQDLQELNEKIRNGERL